MAPSTYPFSKRVIAAGAWGSKPGENSECQITVTDCGCHLAGDFCMDGETQMVVVGDGGSELRRHLDLVLLTMNVGEVARIETKIAESAEAVTFTVHLIEVNHRGHIHQWDARAKRDLATRHKERGVALYRAGRPLDGAHCWTKALRVLCSIPISVESPPPRTIDGVALADLEALKATLRCNLAGAYVKLDRPTADVIALCRAVLRTDPNNVKANYRAGAALLADRSFEEAAEAFDRVLRVEPGNRAAAEQLKKARSELQKTNAHFNVMVKRMFEKM